MTKQAKSGGVLGIDIGGSGIKGAPVDLATGTLLTERVRVPTPEGARPEDVAAVVAQLAAQFSAQFPGTVSSPIGVTFPGIVRGGLTLSAANVDKSWIGLDADAAGVAEARYGAGRGVRGVVMLLTFGTGIGSALMYNGVLVPNTELGHLELNGQEVEPWASGAAKDREGLSWKAWGKRASEYLEYLERLFSPDLFIIGGGLSKKADKWSEHLSVKTPFKPAALQNEAGIVGAALTATERQG